MIKNVYSVHGVMPNGEDVMVGGLFYETKKLAKTEAKRWAEQSGGSYTIKLVKKKVLDEMSAMGIKFMVLLEKVK